MKSCKDIDFLARFWIEAKRIAEDIKQNLPNGVGEGLHPTFQSGGAKMFLVQFSQLGNSWHPKDILYNVAGRSTRVEALSDKIHNMIYKGRANDVKPMVEKICTGRKKKLTKKCKGLSGEHLGYGSFKWNNQAYTLNDGEINHIKEFFKL